MQLIKGVGAFCGCFSCLDHGTKKKNCPTEYSRHSGVLRYAWHYSNERFITAAMGYEGIPSLASLIFLNFDPIMDNALDPMHNIFLGVTKALFFFFFKPVKRGYPLPHPWNIYQHQKAINKAFLTVRVPHDWGRKPRTLDEAKLWKGQCVTHIDQH